MLALALPWYVMAEIRTPGFLQYFIVGEHFLRFVDPGWQGDLYGTAHKRPYGGIWLDWLLATMPWGLAGLWLFLRPGQDAPLRTRLASLARDPLRAYLLLWGLAAPAFFTLSGNILWTYVLPSLPPLALALGAWMADHAPTQGWRARLPAALMLLTPLAALTLGALSLAQPERYKTEKQLVAQASRACSPASSWSSWAAGRSRRASIRRARPASFPWMPWRRRRPCRGRRAPLPGGRKEPPAGLARHAGRLAAAAALRQPALRAAASRKRRRRGAR